MTVVVGYLPTREGRQGMASAVEEAQRRHTDLVIVVSEKSAPTEQERQQRDHDIEGFVGQAIEAGVQASVEVLSERKDVADDLISVADQRNAQVIVIGLRRRSPVGKLILGSNAQRILLDAPCPVLAVKPVRPV
ncbi:universal stress protein [Jonesia denitrificans]|uniref:UspA domain protein n=1 Tax=Jonesia denitrificans (strain ATCC 14870 / DSM 20603 / BCRC 15368 / CIP 55.134 / JCM 11481 / NBRC 15587 / NCTC 10816 / Prevot 55134) TaxID=471856 RepID=C7R4M3_JONDD|nr:universal stress protein [Jonesia denitrificans]ACV09080.1 UspA domain protein [Jonesia denitrificans DSM 20603]ASE09631.1 universal stress protein [Jonesia denitrificans]QXB44171.1 universal stress protein [Jonesia denitrificans]SQH21235.1 Universal stress protein family [Jonesia denitrificans]